MLVHPGVFTTNQVPLVVAQDNVLYKTVRGLAVTQLIIGILSILLGIVMVILSIQNFSFGQGIWGGVWIFITGIIGMASPKNPTSFCVTGTYMAFNIVSTVATFFAVFILGGGIAYYSNCDDPRNSNDTSAIECVSNSTAVLGLYIPLILLMIIDFFVSIVAAVYSCKTINCCCKPQQQQQQQQQTGMIIPQQRQYQIMPSNQGQTVFTSPSGYPAVSYPAASCATSGYYQPQYSAYQQVGVMSTPGQMCPGQMVSQPHTAMYVSSQGQPISPQTNIVYSTQPNAPLCNVAPPTYDSLFEAETKNTVTPS